MLLDKIDKYLNEKKTIKFIYKNKEIDKLVDATIVRPATKEDGYGKGFYLLSYKDPLTNNSQEKFMHKSLFRDKKGNLIK